MRLEMPLDDGLALAFDDRVPGEGDYPTGRLQKGLTLLDRGEQLAQEGVGFGVPVLKLGVRTVFAGRAEVDSRRRDGRWELDAVYAMDLVERLARPGGATVHPAPLYAAKDRLAALHRRSPVLRGVLTATSAALRRALRWETVYEQVSLVATIPVRCSVDVGSGSIEVVADLSGMPDQGVTEVVLMNELGAGHFDRYEDTSGLVLSGDGIGTWDDVAAAEAAFVSRRRGVRFSVQQVEGARLRRGREVVGSRLAWSGFGYSLAPDRRSFRYQVTIARRG